MTENEMVGWHHRLEGHKCEQALAVGNGQGGMVQCGSWGRKELDTTERLNSLKFSTESTCYLLNQVFFTYKIIACWV